MSFARLSIEGSTVAGNTADRGGGGISSDGPLTLVNSTVSNNRALGVCGALDGVGGGIIHGGARPLRIAGSTFSGNEAPDGGSSIHMPVSGGVVVVEHTDRGRLRSKRAGIRRLGLARTQHRVARQYLRFRPAERPGECAARGPEARAAREQRRADPNACSRRGKRGDRRSSRSGVPRCGRRAARD